MTPNLETRLAAALVLRGVLSPADAKLGLALLEKHRPRHHDLTLDIVLVKKGMIDEDRLKIFRWAEGLLRGQEPFGAFVLLELVGQGGMSTVYRARRNDAHEIVALKLLLPSLVEDPVAYGRFQAEARLLLRLDHPNVVKGYELETFLGVPYLAMELVNGSSIQEHLDERKVFEEDAALYVIMQIAEALRYLADQGVLHRDIKPGNILLTRENVVKLCDLGLAHSERKGEVVTGKEDSTVGTLQYISPEQARGGTDVDIRSDIYSLGVTLYHMVMGEVPFTGSDDREVLAQRLLESLSSPLAKSRSLSPHLHYFIHKMTAQDRDVRYQGAEELISDIKGQIRGKKTLRLSEEGKPAAELDKPFEDLSARRSSTSEGVRKKRAQDRLRIRRLKDKRRKR